MIVTFRFSGRGTVHVEGAEHLTLVERLQIAQAIMPPTPNRRGEAKVRNEVTCAWCGREVLGRSTKRKFCGVRCRTTAHRASKGDAPLADDDERPEFEVLVAEPEGYAVRSLLGG